MAQIQVFFKQGVDPDIAAVNVQNRVARANPLLPREVTQSGVITQKRKPVLCVPYYLILKIRIMMPPTCKTT